MLATLALAMGMALPAYGLLYGAALAAKAATKGMEA